MAGLGVGAVGGIELMTSTDETFEFAFEGGELTLSGLDVEQLVGEQLADVGAGRGTIASQFQDGGDLDQGEPGPLSVADELESGEGRGVIDPVLVGPAAGRGEQALALVEADGLGRQARGGGEFSDAHALNLRLDLAS